ncbi:MAG: DUF5686 family protein [Bacteroidota bacterium]
MVYGFRDRRIKYGGDVRWMFSKHPRIMFGAGYKDDVTFSSANTEAIGEGNLFSGIYRRPVIQKLLHVREAKAFYERYWKKGWSNRLTLLHQSMDPYGAILENGAGFNFGYLPNPEAPSRVDTTVAATEFIFKTRYAKGEQFLTGNFFRTSLGTKHPIIELQYTMGVKGILGGDYTYHKVKLSYRHYFNINPIGWLSYRFEAGKVFGTVPFLLMEVHPGNETYFYSNSVFNGANRYEFASDTYATIKLIHHFDGFILNKFPLLRKLKWRSVATFKAIYGTMSDANEAANRLNLFDPSNTETYTGFRAPSPVPYMETGFGIENIFKVIRLDLLWRLNYRDNPEAGNLIFRGSFDFYF